MDGVWDTWQIVFSGGWRGYVSHGRSCLAGDRVGMCHMADLV